MKKFKVTGGLGRLCQFPKTVEVMAKNADDAHWKAMNPIRELITEQDFGGDRNAPMLSKVINSETIEEIKPATQLVEIMPKVFFGVIK